MKQRVLVVGILLTIMSFVLSACGVTTPVMPTDTPISAPALKPVPKLSDLKVLVTIGGGSELVPKFSPDVTEYALSINSDITGIGIIPSLPNQSTDKIIVDGNVTETGATATVTPVVIGASVIKIVVSAEGGKNTTYTIAVNREDIQPLVNKFLKITFADPVTGVNMGYRLFVPENYDPTRSYPLVMFLHGAGQVGNDNEIQIANDEATVWAKPEEQSTHPSFVLAPQSNMDPSADKAFNRYGNIGWTSLMLYGLEKPFEPQDQLATAYDILQKVKSEYNIDQKRIYLTGLSMGGFGTFSLAIAHPDEFAALVPICGGGDPAKLASISKIPIWIFHAQEDPVIPVHMSQDSVKALEDAGGAPKYTEYPAGTYFFPSAHYSWVPAYANTEMRDWLFQQSK
jgi:predicted peptidase